MRAYRWINGPPEVRRIGNREVRITRGEVIELDLYQLTDLMARGHEFEAIREDVMDERVATGDTEDSAAGTDEDVAGIDEQPPVDEFGDQSPEAEENDVPGWSYWRST